MRGLFLLFALVWLAAAPADAASEKPVVIGPAEANASAQAGALILIDIRQPQEWRQTGVATPARTISMHDPGGPNGFLNAIIQAVGGDRARPIALICASGVRSTWAQRFLAARGFRQVYNVKEGMLGTGARPGWIRRGLPVRAYLP